MNPLTITIVLVSALMHAGWNLVGRRRSSPATCLARAYGEADFTATYPVARALPVLLVACGDVALGHPVPTAAWIGMMMVVAGCMCAPLQSFREITLYHYANRGNAWVILAALGTVGFTLL